MKLENDLSKLARWAIPGWVAILTFYAFVSTDILFTIDKSQRLFPTINEFVKSMSSIEAAFLALLVAAAGVPIGFLIYQTYFFFRWNSPFARDGFLFPLSQGRMNDLKSSVRDLKIAEITQGSDWRLRFIYDPLFFRDHAFQWNYLQSLFFEACQKIDSKYLGLSTYSRYRYLHEVMHTLGSSVFATYFGFLGYLALKYMKVQNAITDHIIFLVISMVVLFALLNKEEEVKLQMEKEFLSRGFDKNTAIPDITENLGLLPTFSFIHRKGSKDKYIFSIVSPGLLFLFAFALFHFFGNPSLNANVGFVDTAYRVILAIMAGAIWMASRKNPSTDIRNGDFLAISFTLILALVPRIFANEFARTVDWAYLTVMFEFLVIILILTKNRQNTKDELSVLEYYTLRRYVTDEDYLIDDSQNKPNG